MRKIKRALIFALLVLMMAAELFLPEIREDIREREAAYAGEEERIAATVCALSRNDEGEDGLPHQCAHWIAMTGDGGFGCEDAELDGLTEEERNESALLLSGYYRDDVPLSYELQAALHAICEQYGVEYALALGLIEVESSFDTEAVSSCGCYGLMQLNPLYFPEGMTPFENIYAGVAYLAEQMERYGDTAAALTAYHAGHDNGERGYARAVLTAAERWKQ